jgi:hypothetical protein
MGEVKRVHFTSVGWQDIGELWDCLQFTGIFALLFKVENEFFQEA